jgi:hypothetical protein
MKKQAGKTKIIVINVVVVVLSTIIAIVAHAILPAEVNVDEFDSIFVKALGFPVIASLYFLILFTHCAIIINYFGKKSSMTGKQIGLRYGLSFALIYLIGMQEIVVDASPFAVWGIDFVKYQIFMGLGDAIPVFILCMIIGHFTHKNIFKGTHTHKNNLLNNIVTICFITLAIFIVRIICYKTGIIYSNYNKYPLPCSIWTILFGVTLGFIFIFLKPVYVNMKLYNTKLIILTIGLNWIIFNSFIGLIFKGVMPQMILRSIIDTFVLYVIVMILEIIKVKRKKEEEQVAF